MNAHMDAQQNFLEEVKKGYENISSKSIVVCVACRDVGNRIQYLLNTFTELNKICKNLSVLFFENDSTDNTVGVVEDWCNKNEYGKLYSEKLNFPKFGSFRIRQNHR